MRRTVRVLLFSLWFVATSVGTAGAKFAQESTQILNHLELIAQYEEMVVQTHQQLMQLEQLINQYRNMVQNTLNLPLTVWADVTGQLNRLAGLVRQGEALAYSLSNLDQEFQNRFRGYNFYLNQHMTGQQFSTQYATWTKQTQDTIRGCMLAGHEQMEGLGDEEADMRRLLELSESSEGRMQALQVGNQITAQMLPQMQKLRQLVTSQMQGAYLAYVEEKEAMQRAEMEKYYSRPPDAQPGGKRY
jgi:P-type conjugative transfer protein TrbJ